MTSHQKILLVEPTSKNTYPPLGLMKIATYYKLKGDKVCYVYGNDKWYMSEFWDAIYISSVFTYDLSSLIKTIKFYSKNLFNFKNIKVGGIAATLMADEVEALTGIRPHLGALNSFDEFLYKFATSENWASYLISDNYYPCIDMLPPDYSILGNNNQYHKIINNAYMLYSTKGCPNRCPFCAVHILEPDFINYIPIKPRIEYIIKNYGQRTGLLLLDNNVAASKEFYHIIDEIKDLGFQEGSKLNKKKRFVDFNQGVDARILDRKMIKKLSEICIKPLRLAFDDIHMEEIYTGKMSIAIEYGIKNLSNYILYNYKDRPVDLYKRLKITVDLNKKLNSKIFSFPMKFIPLRAKDRFFLGQHWTKRQLRAVQIILNVTNGIVSPRNDFFEHAFGQDEKEFHEILLMPQEYILYRVAHEENGSIDDWRKLYNKLTNSEKNILFNIIKDGRLKDIPTTKNLKINKILSHYECELREDKTIHIMKADPRNIALVR
jgi:hypothetical protein